MKAQYFKISICQHCNKEFQIARSDQKFCSTSHRAANHSLKKRLAIKLAIKDTSVPKFQNSPIEKEQLPTSQPSIIDHNVLQTGLVIDQQDYKSTFLKDLAAAALANTAIEGIKSLKGVNNSDIMEMLRANNAALMEITNQLIALKEEQNVKNSKSDSADYTPISVNLLN
jgi:hypothetical protein